jgi:phosphotransferase system  glucose/maltose/N-acetylglucosamine-specific IIC component
MARNETHTTLGVVSFGLAIGITWAIGVFFLAIMAGYLDWGVPIAALLQTVYIGYSPSFVGAITGAVWGFFDGFICGAVVAWLYNRLLLARQRHLR